MPSCCVPGCTSRNSTTVAVVENGCSSGKRANVRLFRFPKISAAAEQWTKNINRKNTITGSPWKPNTNSVVCSIHFVDGRPSKENPYPTEELGHGEQKRRYQRKTAVPNLRPHAEKRKYAYGQVDSQESSISGVKILYKNSGITVTGSTNGNILDTTGRDTFEEYEQCQEQKIRHKAQSSSERVTKNDIRSLVSYCTRLIQLRSSMNMLKCNCCGQLLFLSPNDSKQDLCDVLLNHSTKHSAMTSLHCLMCDYNSHSLIDLQQHIQHKHDRLVSLVNICSAHGLSTQRLNIIDCCFGGGLAKQIKPPEQDQSTAAHYSYVRNVLGQRALELPEIACNICGEMVKMLRRGSNRIPAAYNHAVGHLVRPMYSCRVCPYTGSTKTGVRDHVRRKHNAKQAADLYSSNVDLYNEQIKGVIDQCYGENDDNECFSNDLKPFEHGSFAGLHQHVQQLITKYAEGTKLVCSECKKQTVVQWGPHKLGTQFAIDHAARHLGHLLYFCQSCPESKFGLHAMLAHGHIWHKENVKNGWWYINRSNEHEQELLQILTKCYDREQGNLGLEKSEHQEEDKGRKVDIDGELKLAQWGKSGNAIGQQNKIQQRKHFGPRKLILNVKYVWKKSQYFQCPYCSMKSNHSRLVQRHVKLVHKMKPCGNLGFK